MDGAVTLQRIYIYIQPYSLWARLPPQIQAFFGKDEFDMFNISAI